ncbi:MAG: hypothetical protein H6Q72_1693 [Firmicutes bacterium]|nr:hypothetical protein [Bacillota bacterium]
MENANKIDFSMSEEEFQKLLDELSNVVNMEFRKEDNIVDNKTPKCA